VKISHLVNLFLSLNILGILSFNQTAFATISHYNPPEILARANITDGFNIPPMSFLNNTSPVINNNGDVAFKIVSVGGVNTQVIWVKKHEEASGSIVYEAPDERFITEPSISDNGKIAFNLYDEGVTDGLFLLDIETKDAEQVLDPDKRPIQFYTYPQVVSNNSIYFRGTDDFNDRSFFEYSGDKLNKIISEGVESLGIKSSYLFRPTVNEVGQIAFKARLGEKGQWDESNPDSIILLTPGTSPVQSTMTKTIIAKDIDGDPHSVYTKFGNSVSLSNHGLVAFMGQLSDSKKVIVVSKDNILTTYAKEGESGISEIEMFAPKINDQGTVLFRAKDNEGKRSLFLADGVNVKRVIGEGDEIQTDLGAGKILSNPNFPGFGGEIDMNDQGEIVFYCIIVSSDNKELGSAIYKITPKNN
jgi:hypothetical protein